MAKASDVFVREESGAIDAKPQEQLDRLQMNRTIQYVSIDCIRKAEQEEDWSALEAERCLSGLGCGVE